MRRALSRLLVLLGAVPFLVVLVAFFYMLLMEHVEGSPRTFWEALLWSSETLTSVGYGKDNAWESPIVAVFVVTMQFLGVGMVFVVIGVYLAPMFEETFVGRLPRRLPKKFRDYVLIYRYGPAVSSLVDQLHDAKVPTVVFEEDESMARRMIDHGQRVIYGRLEDGDPDPVLINDAKALVLNGADHDNGAIILQARQQGYKGDIVALAEDPLHREPMVRGGATHVYTPQHMLAAALAARASELITPSVPGVGQLGGEVEVAELRVNTESEIAGQTLASAKIRDRTGVTVLGQWIGSEFNANPGAQSRVRAGDILIIGGTKDAVGRAAELGRLLPSKGHTVILGYGEVGGKLGQLLKDSGEEIRTLDKYPRDGVEVVGDAMDRNALESVGVRDARAVIVAVGTDSATLFVTSIIRSLAPDVRIIVRVDRQTNVQRITQAGADFAMSLGQVAGQLIGHHLLGEEFLSLGPHHRLTAVSAKGHEGQNPKRDRLAQQTGCTVIAVRRGDETIAVFDDSFSIEDGDELFVWGEPEVIAQHFER
jgi:Trk K+ transport system NAD-binding subunit